MTTTLAIEGALNLISALGVGAYLSYIFRNPHRTLFERRVSVLLSAYFIIIVTRGYVFSMGVEDQYTTLMLAFSILFPFTAVLFVEGLIRRHVPRWLKIYAALAPVALLTLLAFGSSETSRMCTACFQLSMLACLTGILFTHRSGVLTNTELALKQKIGVAFVIGSPFFLSDLAQVFDLSVMRIGCVGGLIFVLSCLKYNEENSRRKLVRLLVLVLSMAAVVAVILCFLVTGWNLREYTAMFSLVIVLHLTALIINDSLFTVSGHIRSWSLRVLDEYRQGSDPVAHINETLSGEGTFAYGERELEMFDVQLIKDYLGSQSPELRLPGLRKLKQNLAAEQLRYILETDQNDTLMVLHLDPLVLLSMNNPTVTRDVDLRGERVVLSRFVELALGRR